MLLPHPAFQAFGDIAQGNVGDTENRTLPLAPSHCLKAQRLFFQGHKQKPNGSMKRIRGLFVNPECF
jgi:hypothetical protein